MEGLQPLHRRVYSIDVHCMLHVACVLIEQADGSIERQTRQFGGFRRDCRALAAWLAESGMELVVMESTGIYWKSVFSHLERRYPGLGHQRAFHQACAGAQDRHGRQRMAGRLKLKSGPEH